MNCTEGTVAGIMVERLARYHRRIAERRGRLAAEPVTSASLARDVHVDATQVRKDFGNIGLRGRGRVGYDVDEVVTALRRALGFDRTHRAVIVGAGHLASALIAYRGFAKYGLHIEAAFDSDPARVGARIGDCPVLPVDGVAEYVQQHRVRLGIVTTPVEAAQGVTDTLIAADVQAIWNFAPVRLLVPEGVRVRDEHISVGLAELTSHLAKGF